MVSVSNFLAETTEDCLNENECVEDMDTGPGQRPLRYKYSFYFRENKNQFIVVFFLHLVRLLSYHAEREILDCLGLELVNLNCRIIIGKLIIHS